MHVGHMLVSMEGDHPRVINPKQPPEPIRKMLLILHMHNRYHACMLEHQHLRERAAECAQLRLEVERLKEINAALRAEITAIEHAELSAFLDTPHECTETTPLKHSAKNSCCVIL